MRNTSRRNLIISVVAFCVVCAIGLILVISGHASHVRAPSGSRARTIDVVLVAAVAALVAAGLHRLLRYPAALQEKIDARTQELQGSLIKAWLQKRQLQAAQDHVRGILRSTPDAVVAGTGTGIITEWNDAAERLYGWTREQALGRNISFLIPPGEPSAMAEYGDALGSGRKIRVVVPRIRSDGSRFLAELTVSGFRDERGQLRSWVSVVRDVTEQQVVRDARSAMASDLDPVHALRGLADTLHRTFGTVALALAAAEGDRIRRMVSVTADGRLLAGEESIALDDTAAGRAVRSGRPVVVRDTGTDPTLGPTHVRWFAVLPLVARDTVVATLTAGFDGPETPSEKTLDLLTQIAEAVAQDVGNMLLFERERETARRLKEVDELKSDFLSTVSHELRTPLTTICGFAATLDEHWDDIEEHSRRQFVRRVLRNADRLDELIGGLLDFSRLERGGLDLSVSPWPLVSELEREIAKHDRVRKTHDVEVAGDRTLLALADPQALSRVVGNLLTNAAKFSEPGSRIVIRAGRLRGEAVVSVTDEGVGIPPYEQERVFKRFYRVQRGDRVVAEGTGIGLAIVKQFVEAQGGRVWLESQPNEGTTFFFTLPLAEQDAQAPFEIDGESPSANGDRRSADADYTRVSRPAQ